MSACAPRPDFTRSLSFGLLLSVVFLLIHAAFLERHGLWEDEFHTYDSVRSGYVELIKHRVAAGHMPGYFFLVHASCKALGFNEWGLRAPSVLAGTFAFFLFFLMTRRYLKDTRVFLTSLLLLLVNPFFYWACRDARMYSFVVLFSLASTFLLLLHLEESRRRWLAGYAAVMVLGFFIHRLTALMMLPHLLMVLGSARARKAPWLWTGAGILLLFGVVNWAIFRGSVTPVTGPDERGIHLMFPDPLMVLRRWGALATTSMYMLSSNFLKSSSAILSQVTVGSLLGLAVWRFRRESIHSPGANPENALPGRALACWLLAPSLILLLAKANANVNSGAVRYFLMVQPALLIALAYGFWTVPGGAWRIFSWAARIAYAAILCMAVVVQWNWMGPGMREGTQYIRKYYRPGDQVLLTNGNGKEQAFHFYHGEKIPYELISRNPDNAGTLPKSSLPQKKLPPGTRVLLFIETNDKKGIMKAFEKNPALEKIDSGVRMYEVSAQAFQVKQTP